MTTLESLKNLSVALDCGECTSDNVADAIQFMADNYPQPDPNLFNINGEVDFNYTGNKQNLNSVSDGVLTCNANRSSNHAVGQLIDTVVGKTYKFKTNAISLGNGYGVAIRCYEYNNNDDSHYVYKSEIGELEYDYVATSIKTLFGFNTTGGTGAQFKDIEVKEIENLFNRDTSVNGILNVETGDIYTPAENIKTSDYISLKAGTYKITSTKNNAQSVYYDWYVCSYGSDNTFIERVGMTREDDTTYTFTVSEDIKLRFTYSTLLTDIVLKNDV